MLPPGIRPKLGAASFRRSWRILPLVHHLLERGRTRLFAVSRPVPTGWKGAFGSMQNPGLSPAKSRREVLIVFSLHTPHPIRSRWARILVYASSLCRHSAGVHQHQNETMLGFRSLGAFGPPKTKKRKKRKKRGPTHSSLPLPILTYFRTAVAFWGQLGTNYLKFE